MAQFSIFVRFFSLFFYSFFLFSSPAENWRSLIKEVFSGLFGDFKRSIDLVRGNQSLLNSNLNWNVKAQIIKKSFEKERKENNQCIHFRWYVSTSVFKSTNTEKRKKKKIMFQADFNKRIKASVIAISFYF